MYYVTCMYHVYLPYSLMFIKHIVKMVCHLRGRKQRHQIWHYKLEDLEVIISKGWGLRHIFSWRVAPPQLPSKMVQVLVTNSETAQEIATKTHSSISSRLALPMPSSRAVSFNASSTWVEKVVFHQSFVLRFARKDSIHWRKSSLWKYEIHIVLFIKKRSHDHIYIDVIYRICLERGLSGLNDNGSACWASDILSVIAAFVARNTVAVLDVFLRMCLWKRVYSTKTSSVAMLRELPPNLKYLHCIETYRNLPAMTNNMLSEVKMHWIHPDILVYPTMVCTQAMVASRLPAPAIWSWMSQDQSQQDGRTKSMNDWIASVPKIWTSFFI